MQPEMPATAGELSPKERSAWFLQRLTPDQGVLNVPTAFLVGEPLRSQPLAEAAKRLVRRHPALRTLFPANGELPSRLVLPADDARAQVEVESFDGSGSLMADALRAFAGRPFDLTSELPIRIGHFTGWPEGDVIAVVAHHIVFDASSGAVLTRELLELYRHLSAGDPVPQELAREVPPSKGAVPDPASVAFWTEHLTGTPPQRIAAARQDDDRALFAGHRVTRSLPAEVCSQFSSLSKELRITANILLLSAYVALLSRAGAGEDVVVGLPIDTRGRKDPDAVGYHMNLVAMRFQASPDMPFNEFARRVRSTFMASLKHATVSVDDVFPAAYGGLAAGQEPLFRYLFNFIPDRVTGVADDGSGVRLLEVDTGYSRLDLDFTVLSHGSHLDLRTVHRRAVLETSQVEALTRSYIKVLERVAEAPAVPLAALDVESLAPASTRATVPPGAENGSPLADGDLVALLRSLWSELLETTAVSDDTHFFRSGGTSLLAARLVPCIRERTGVKVTLRDIFRRPTPAGLAARISAI